MRQRDARARCAHDVELGRRGGSGSNGIERTRGARRVALHRLMNGFRKKRIAHGIRRVFQRHQRMVQRVSRLHQCGRIGLLRRVIEECVERAGRSPLALQHQPVDDVVGGD